MDKMSDKRSLLFFKHFNKVISMFFNNLSLIIKSNIKQYQDEKQLEKENREAILLKIQETNDINEIYELDKKLAENEYSAERNFIGRLYEVLTKKYEK